MPAPQDIATRSGIAHGNQGITLAHGLVNATGRREVYVVAYELDTTNDVIRRIGLPYDRSALGSKQCSTIGNTGRIFTITLLGSIEIIESARNGDQVAVCRTPRTQIAGILGRPNTQVGAIGTLDGGIDGIDRRTCDVEIGGGIGTGEDFVVDVLARSATVDTHAHGLVGSIPPRLVAAGRNGGNGTALVLGNVEHELTGGSRLGIVRGPKTALDRGVGGGSDVDVLRNVVEIDFRNSEARQRIRNRSLDLGNEERHGNLDRRSAFAQRNLTHHGQTGGSDIRSRDSSRKNHRVGQQLGLGIALAVGSAVGEDIELAVLDLVDGDVGRSNTPADRDVRRRNSESIETLARRIELHDVELFDGLLSSGSSYGIGTRDGRSIERDGLVGVLLQLGTRDVETGARHFGNGERESLGDLRTVGTEIRTAVGIGRVEIVVVASGEENTEANEQNQFT